MGYKRIDNNMTFAEMSLMSSMENNRSLKRFIIFLKQPNGKIPENELGKFKALYILEEELGCLQQMEGSERYFSRQFELKSVRRIGNGLTIWWVETKKSCLVMLLKSSDGRFKITSTLSLPPVDSKVR